MKSYEGKRRPAESNGRLLPGLWRDSLHVTCGLTACTPGSAPGPTLGNEYGKTLLFYLYFIVLYWHDDGRGEARLPPTGGRVWALRGGMKARRAPVRCDIPLLPRFLSSLFSVARCLAQRLSEVTTLWRYTNTFIIIIIIIIITMARGAGWLGSPVVSVLDSVAEGPGLKIAAATLSGNSLRQTVHTHVSRAS